MRAIHNVGLGTPCWMMFNGMRPLSDPRLHVLCLLMACGPIDDQRAPSSEPSLDAGGPMQVASDADNTGRDEPSQSWLDASTSSPDASLEPTMLVHEAGTVLTPFDASDSDASFSGECDDSAPHGCYRASHENPLGCPPQIPEQSDFYPPLEEWLGCEAPWYVPCVYYRPDGSEANCSCDLGFHWLCLY